MSSTNPVVPPTFGDSTILVDQPRRAFVEQIMGLPISLHVRGPRARGVDVARAAAELFAALTADDAMFSTWKPHSTVSRIRRGELRIEDAAPRLQLVAALCEEASARTGDLFSAWLPRPDKWDGPAGSDGEVQFDPSGLVKGWAVQQSFGQLIERLAGLGPHDVLVSAGGDVVVNCARVDTPDWMIGVEDPRDRTRTIITVPLRSGAIATSGIAARGEHIVNPVTGTPARELLSATVIGPDLTWADVYATAAFVRGAGAADWIRAFPDHAAVLVGIDGQITLSAGS